MDELISPSHALQGPDVSGSGIGPEAYKRQLVKWWKGLPDLYMTILDVVGEYEKIVVAWTLSGTHQGELAGAD